MNPIKKIWQSIRKGGAKIGMVDSLRTITDHPKINVDPSEYRRIQEGMKYYEGKLPDEEYLNAEGQTCKRKFYDLPMTVIASDYLANLIVNESFEVSVGDEKSEVNVFVQQALEDNDFKKNFGKYLSPQFGVGGLAVRPFVDGDKLKFNWALADSFFPLRNNTNNISEGVFISHSTNYEGKKAQHYTLFEFHEWVEGTYTITNELYKSEDSSEIGIRVNLKELYPDVEPVSYFTEGITRPLFGYLKPSGFNNISVRSPLGLGVADNCKTMLDQINETNNQMHYDMKKAKPRIVGSEHYFNMTLPENGLGPKFTFDKQSDEFMVVGGDQPFLEDLTFKFDPEPYERKVNYHLRFLEKKLKLQQGTFSFNYETGIKTATQVVSEDSDTFRTRNMEISQIEDFLKELIVSMCELGKAFKIYTGEIPLYKDIEINFDDGIFTNKQQEQDFYAPGVTNKTLSRIGFMKRVYKMTDEDAQAELEAIANEDKMFSPEHSETMSQVSMFGREE